MVEHGTENAGVPSSILGLSTTFLNLEATITSSSFGYVWGQSAGPL